MATEIKVQNCFVKCKALSFALKLIDTCSPSQWLQFDNHCFVGNVVGDVGDSVKTENLTKTYYKN